jgi:hypothetical protein
MSFSMRAWASTWLTITTARILPTLTGGRKANWVGTNEQAHAAVRVPNRISLAFASGLYESDAA